MTDLPLRPPESSPFRPRVVTYLAIAAMVFGALGTIGCGLNPLSESFSIYKVGGMQTPEGALVPYDRGLLHFTTVTSILDLLSSAVLFVSAYAVLRYWPWGRRTAIVVSAVIIVIAAAKMFGGLTAMRQPRMDHWMALYAATPADKRQTDLAQYQQQITRMSYIAPVLMFAIQAFIPTLILLIWRRPTLDSAFTRSGSAA